MNPSAAVKFLLLLVVGLPPDQAWSKQPSSLLEDIRQHYGLDAKAYLQLTKIFTTSKRIGTGNPQVTRHTGSRQQCLTNSRNAAAFVVPGSAKICGHRFMVPIYDVRNEKPKDARSCIDQFEFPNIPCQFPVVWTRASEAHLICQAVGKRLCDSHEWEAACAGSAPAAAVSSSGKDVQAQHRHQRSAHNKSREVRWAYGMRQDHRRCATASQKSPGCDQAIAAGRDAYSHCGSNTYPAGSFLGCRSPSGVYDQHGNVAEHMNLALTPSQSTRLGGSGYTEMKGSWFVFQRHNAHPDDCHWRAPFWHGSELTSRRSHSYYHLGFRCCKTIEKR